MIEELNAEFELYCKDYTPILINASSTNTYSRENIDRISDNTVIVAPSQDGGRGRENRFFISKEGGAYFSIVNKIDCLTLDETVKFVYAAGLSVSAVLREYGVEAGLKWPNDVFVNEKKICGILCECVTDAFGAASIITGIGINIYNDISDVPSATRLGEHVLHPVSIPKLIAGTVYFYDKLLQLNAGEILERYKKECITIGREVVIVSSGDTGRAVSVNEEGFLEVDINGEIVEVKAGDVSLKELLC